MNDNNKINNNNENIIDSLAKHDMLLLNYDKITAIQNEQNNSIYKTDEYKFYRKRIFQLVKNIMNKKCDNSEIKGSFELFIKDAIEYFKFLDKADIIQEEYEKSLFVKDKNNFGDDNTSPKTPFGLGVIPEEVNNLICKEHDLKTMDIQKCLNVKIIYPEPKETFKPPIQKEYNLNDPKFKNKGVVIKKN